MKKRILALLLAFILLLTSCGDDSATSYDQIKASDYITIDQKDYIGFDLNLNIYDATEVELESEIARLLNQYKPKEVYQSTDDNYIPKITAGDVVEIYYRGYILNEDGSKNYHPGMSNIPGDSSKTNTSGYITSYGNSYVSGGYLTSITPQNVAVLVKSTGGYYNGSLDQSNTIIDGISFPYYNMNISTGFYSATVSNSNPYKLTIGSGAFVPGFETALIGKTTLDFPSLEVIKSGYTTSNMTVSISYGKIVKDELGHPFRVYYEESVNLAIGEAAINEKYGFDIYSSLINAEIGKSIRLNQETTSGISSLYIRAATIGSYDGYEPIHVKFPAGYSGELSSKDAWFEIYVQSITEYYDDSAGEGIYDDDFVTEVLYEKKPGLANALNDLYPGLSPAEQYMAHELDILKASYKSEFDSVLFYAILDHYYSVAKVKKYPTTIVENLAKKYIDEIEASYKVFTNSRGTYDERYTSENYTLDEYAAGCLGMSSLYNQSWRDKAFEMAEEEVKRNLVLRYIIEKENLDISSDNMDKLINDVIDTNYSSFLSIYLNSTGKSYGDYNDYDLLKNDVISYIKEKYSAELTLLVYQKMIYNKAILDFNITIITQD